MEILDVKLSKKETRPRGIDWERIWEQNKILIFLSLTGFLLLSVGILVSFYFSRQKNSEIEIISSENKNGTIWIDLEGAVIQPGVYELPNGSRIKDLLAQAGGLSAQADRNWVEKNLNLASKLIDGQKVYIPYKDEKEGEQEIERVAGVKDKTEKININTASQSQLESLWGVGEVRARAIINNRPYNSIDELLTKRIIPSNVFEKIKENISVF